MRFRQFICLSVLLCWQAGCFSGLWAEVRVTCIVEPSPQLKKAKKLGCDFKNLDAQPVVLSAADVRDGTFQTIGSPLRYSAADGVVERSERRGFWGTFFQVVKWVGVAASFAQGLDFIKLEDNWRYLIPTTTGALQTIDSVGRGQHDPLTMPPDYLPEGDFVLDAHETRSYVLMAAEPVFTSSFRISLPGRVMSAGVSGQGVGNRQAVEHLYRDALDWINDELRDELVSIEEFQVIPQRTMKRTGGGSRLAVPQAATLIPASFDRKASGGNIQAEPVKGVEVPTVAGESFDGELILAAASPLCCSRFVYAGKDAAAAEEWLRMARNALVLEGWSQR